jgi:Skp family chaperone for outer membrane proteins
MTSAVIVHYNLRVDDLASARGGSMRATVWTFLMVAALGGSALAQDSKSPEAKAVKIGVLDMDRIMRESDLGKEYGGRIEKVQKEIQEETAKKQAELERMDERINALQEQLEKDRTSLSAEEFEERQYEITKATREREAFFQDGQLELQRKQRHAEKRGKELNEELHKKMVPYVQEAILAQDLDIVIDRRFCVSVSEDLDISSDVIARANKAQPTSAPASK